MSVWLVPPVVIPALIALIIIAFVIYSSIASSLM